MERSSTFQTWIKESSGPVTRIAIQEYLSQRLEENPCAYMSEFQEAQAICRSNGAYQKRGGWAYKDRFYESPMILVATERLS
jgi:hypothetical protein